MSAAAALVLAQASTSYWTVGISNDVCLASQLDFPGGEPPPDVIWGMSRGKSGAVDVRIPIANDHPLAHPYSIAAIGSVRLRDEAGRVVGNYRVSARDAFAGDSERFAIIVRPTLDAVEEQEARERGGDTRVDAMTASNRVDFLNDLGKSQRLELISSIPGARNPALSMTLRDTKDAVDRMGACFAKLRAGEEFAEHFEIES